MPIYSYTGINDKGKKTSGRIDAENERNARAKLRKMGIYPTSLKAGGASGGGLSLGRQIDFKKIFNRIKLQDISLMTRQLSTLLAANIPLVDSLSAMVEQSEHEGMRAIISNLRERVTEGSKLSDAMKAYPKVFNDLYVNMVNAGENSGALDVVLLRLADFVESQQKTRSKITGAMVYPVIMATVGVLLISVLLVFMVPKMTAIFKSQKMTLPVPTQILIFVSDIFSSYWYLVLAVAVTSVIFLKRWFVTPQGREFRDRCTLKLPVFGLLIRQASISRFTRTLGTLLSSGVPMLTAMNIVKNVVSNVHIRKAIEVTQVSVKEGESIAEPLRRSGEFPPLVTHMIAIGEKTGALEKMLDRISDNYDLQMDNTIATLLSLLEPVLIIVMGLSIAFVVMSVMLPILQMGDLGSLQ